MKIEMNKETTEKSMHRRSMMIWRQMINIFGDDWIKEKGQRIKKDGSLTFVARQWARLPDHTDVQIREALAKIGAERRARKIPSFYDFHKTLKGF